VIVSVKCLFSFSFLFSYIKKQTTKFTAMVKKKKTTKQQINTCKNILFCYSDEQYSILQHSTDKILPGSAVKVMVLTSPTAAKRD
jgi:hypothetical protein